MVTNDLYKAIFDIIRDIALNDDISELRRDDSLETKLGFDKMDRQDIALELNKRYRLQIIESDYKSWDSINEIAASIEKDWQKQVNK